MSSPESGETVVDLSSVKSQDPAPAEQAQDEPNLCLKCIWKIPLCGGFCAPTQSSEKSCLRHFSNEETPPQPCLRTHLCRRFWEHLGCCRLFGKVGFACADRHRSKIMLAAFCMSFIAWIFMFASLAAATDSTSSLKNICWSKGDATLDAVTYPPSGAYWKSWIGLNGRVDQTTPTGSTTTTTVYRDWDDDDICTYNGVTFPGCSDCKDDAKGAVSWMVTAIITSIPTMTTDLQRMTVFGDLNCQKMMGVVTGLFSMISTLESLKSFSENCAQRDFWELFSATDDETRTLTTPSGATTTNTINFNGGPGALLIIIATFLRLFDVICHLIVPTPTHQNTFKANDAGEDATLLEYMSKNSTPRNWGQPIEEQGLLDGSTLSIQATDEQADSTSVPEGATAEEAAEEAAAKKAAEEAAKAAEEAAKKAAEVDDAARA